MADPQTSAPDAPKGRRKWGWIFVVLFVLNAAMSLSSMGGANQRAQQADRAALTYNLNSAYTASANARRQGDLSLAMLIGGSVICLIGAALGFRRYK